MTIEVGDRLPEAAFRRVTPEGVETVTTGDVFAGKKVLLFAVPGAFTPTCSIQHLPGYVARAADFRAKGVDTIACVAVNDAFVLDAWARANGADMDKVVMLADGNAAFTKAIGLDLDASGAGLGTRSKRYAMVVEDGVVRALKVEEAPTMVEVSGADVMLASL
jgi:glutaredoxin/glutathione-dependent peroxiredoxin